MKSALLRTLPLLLIIAANSSAIPIPGCMNITEPGEYELASNISIDSNSTGIPNNPWDNYDTCILILSSDVIFDCMGNSITNDGKNAIGIKADSSRESVSNITIRNCTVDGFDVGIYFPGISDSSILDNSVSHSTAAFEPRLEIGEWGPGALKYGSGYYIYGRNNTIARNRAYNNDGAGIQAGGSGHRIFSNDAKYNKYGLALSNLKDSDIENETLMENEEADLDVDSYSCSNNIKDITGSGQREIVFVNSWSTIANREVSGLILCTAHFSVVENVTIKGSKGLRNNGVLILSSIGATVHNSVSEGNLYGFEVEGGTLNQLIGNKATGNEKGFDISSSGNILKGNIAAESQRGGFIIGGDRNLLQNNYAEGNGQGADTSLYDTSEKMPFMQFYPGNQGNGFFIFGSGNMLLSNIAQNNSFSGFVLSKRPANWNILLGNLAQRNTYGFLLVWDSVATSFASADSHPYFNVLLMNSAYYNRKAGYYSDSRDNLISGDSYGNGVNWRSRSIGLEYCCVPAAILAAVGLLAAKARKSKV